MNNKQQKDKLELEELEHDYTKTGTVSSGARTYHLHFQTRWSEIFMISIKRENLAEAERVGKYLEGSGRRWRFAGVSS